MMLICFAAVNGYRYALVKTKGLETQAVEDATDPNVIIQEMTLNGKQSLQERIDAYLYEQGINPTNIAIYVHVFDSGEEYRLNTETDFVAASLYKLPLAMIYYDMLGRREVSEKEEYLYQSIHYEPGGMIAELYEQNTYIPLATLLHEMIVNSDNTAGHILYENLNGWLGFRNLSTQYINTEIQPSFYTYENVTTAHYMNDTLRYLYEHTSVYGQLIADLYDAMPQNYLNLYVANVTAQKYGWYGEYVNAAGIIFDEHPYSIVVLTRLGESGERHIGAINQICYEYLRE